ncbi:hypothetical protein BDB00DRAFT_790232 [Zychaea mexicana]|uniref:uncharacterized protein n=1 Tax=Zychaea mexicana TaxID=64656 RepID=UPI0022FE5B33|nr:uncharacterized protein BDB00DRAFT_790232 [Zychaea mexicana]KAI9490603.1 hypothetical protein BDB00DRAFT_790232 [Zychaea mexicana]
MATGSKFNFHFWTGKAKDTIKNAALGSKKTAPPQHQHHQHNNSHVHPHAYDHAITTMSPTSPEQRERKMSFGRPAFQENRKNSTSPAPPTLTKIDHTSNIGKHPSHQSPSRSTSSDETSPVTPRATNDLYTRRCARCHRDVVKESSVPVGDDTIIISHQLLT